jgi:hypothetical protein
MILSWPFIEWSLVRLMTKCGGNMKPVYCCGGDEFESLELAIQYANHVYMTQGIILGIEKVE